MLVTSRHLNQSIDFMLIEDADCLELLKKPTEFAAIETGIDLGIFRLLAESTQPVSASQLACSSNTDPIMLCKSRDYSHMSHSFLIVANLTARILKHLGATGVITETGPDEYRGTNFSHTLSAEKYADGYPVMLV